MPGIIPQVSIFQLFKDLQNQITALATQQTGGVCQANGKPRVSWGLLSSGDYGFSVTDPNGISNEIWPVSADYGFAAAAQSTSSTSPVALTGSPSVTAYLGASGDALVTVCCYIQLPSLTTNSQTGYVNVVIDGTTYTQVLALGSGIGGATLATTEANVSTTRRLSRWLGAPLTANQDHTFSLTYNVNSGSGGAVTYGAASIVVQPL